MAQESKVKNVLRSTLTGVVNNICLVVLNLIARKLFLQYIGLEYLSVAQLITNIINVLAITELGLSNAVLYMLYKPVVDCDYEKINGIIQMYRKVNHAIGIAIFLFGLFVLPFLHMFINTSIPYQTVYVIYILNLLYTASTYFLSYRAVLFSANQKDYVISIIGIGVGLVRLIIQCLIIYSSKNYLVYLAVTIIMGVIHNGITYFWSGRTFPYIKDKNSYKEADKKELMKNVKAMFSVKFAGVVINNTDNILVSWLNTLMVGLCSNYTIISSQLKSLISIMHNSLMHSLGIASAVKNGEKSYSLFKMVVLVNTYFTGVITVPLGVLWNDFIIIWLGEEYTLSSMIIFSMLLNFGWSILNAPCWLFRDTNGLFVYVKKILIINAVMNLVLSVILGKTIGVGGIYAATVISNVLTDFWYDSNIVYQKVFHKKNGLRYQIFTIGNILLIFGMILLLKHFTDIWTLTPGIWVLKGIICIAAYTAVFMICYGRSKVMKEIKVKFIAKINIKCKK